MTPAANGSAGTGSAGTASAAAALLTPPAPASGAAALATYYGSVEEFVTEFFAKVYVRRMTPTFRWCPQWWRHPEAVSRLTEMWRSWEVLRLDPLLGIGTWYEHHLDHHLPLLTAEAGPFESCDGERAEHYPREHDELPTTTPPAGWWPQPAPVAPEPAGPGSPAS